jgi:hypothetical protein
MSHSAHEEIDNCQPAIDKQVEGLAIDKDGRRGGGGEYRQSTRPYKKKKPRLSGLFLSLAGIPAG